MALILTIIKLEKRKKLEKYYVPNKGSSINDVTVSGGRGQRFCDDNTMALLIKSVTVGGRGFKNCPKFCDVIYGLLLTQRVILD